MTAEARASAPEPTDVVIVDDHGLLAQSLTFALRGDGLTVERCRDGDTKGLPRDPCLPCAAVTSSTSI